MTGRDGGAQAGAPFGSRGTPAADVGRNLRRLRRAKRYSLRDLAERSGLAVNTLSLIENNKTSPSVSTLQQLAVGLAEPIVSFFEMASPAEKVVHLKPDHRRKASFDHGTCELMGAGFPDHRLQPMLVTLHPGADSGQAPIVHTGLEFVYCLDGVIDYDIEGDTYRLEAGDSLLFEAHVPHRWQNEQSQPARALMVLSPTDERDRASERHFIMEDEVGRIRDRSPSGRHEPRTER
jgi:transcriptional regulator with XRE-family HTH domain